MVTRVVEVPPDRLAGWVQRYRGTHPESVLSAADGGLVLCGPLGVSATLQPLLPFRPGPEVAPADLAPALAAHAAAPAVTALLLMRRGGYAVGVATGAHLVHSKVGGRYVQSRTAAGGWSQQRFARRRAGQVQQLVRAAAQAWAALPRDPRPTVLVTGGDRTLCDQLLQEPSLTTVRGLGTERHLDVPDPRLEVLRQAASRAHAILATVIEPES